MNYRDHRTADDDRAIRFWRERARMYAELGVCSAPECIDPACYTCCRCGEVRCSKHTSVSIMGSYGNDQACFMVGCYDHKRRKGD